MKRTARNYEAYLNELYTDTFSESQAVNQFDYLNNGKVKRETIITAHTNHELGTLMRKHDPIGFNVGFGEWEKGN